MKQVNKKINMYAIIQILVGFYMSFSSVLMIREYGMDFLNFIFLFFGASAMLRGFRLLFHYYGAISDMKKMGLDPFKDNPKE